MKLFSLPGKEKLRESGQFQGPSLSRRQAILSLVPALMCFPAGWSASPPCNILFKLSACFISLFISYALRRFSPKWKTLARKKLLHTGQSCHLVSFCASLSFCLPLNTGCSIFQLGWLTSKPQKSSRLPPIPVLGWQYAWPRPASMHVLRIRFRSSWECSKCSFPPLSLSPDLIHLSVARFYYKYPHNSYSIQEGQHWDENNKAHHFDVMY